jgi:hypothetical protein
MADTPVKRVISLKGTAAGFSAQDEAAAAAGDAAYKAILAAHGIASNQVGSPEVLAVAAQASKQASDIAHAQAAAAGLSGARGTHSANVQTPYGIPDLHIETSSGNVTANPSIALRWAAISTPAKLGVAAGLVVAAKLMRLF